MYVIKKELNEDMQKLFQNLVFEIEENLSHDINDNFAYNQMIEFLMSYDEWVRSIVKEEVKKEYGISA